MNEDVMKMLTLMLTRAINHRKDLRIMIKKW